MREVSIKKHFMGFSIPLSYKLLKLERGVDILMATLRITSWEWNVMTIGKVVPKIEAVLVVVMAIPLENLHVNEVHGGDITYFIKNSATFWGPCIHYMLPTFALVFLLLLIRIKR